MMKRLVTLLGGLAMAGGAWAQRGPPRPVPAMPAAPAASSRTVSPSTTEDADAAEGQMEQQGETDSTDVVEADPGAPKVSGNKRDVAPGEVHTVVKGDTLWDLSQRILGSPWYWPKVWSYNPEIANPHWIHPGNEVRFFPSGEEVPTRLEVANAGGDRDHPSMVGADDESYSSEMIQVEDDRVHVAGGKPLVYQSTGATRMTHQGFVTKREVEEAGVIDSSFAESLMLSYPDSAYVRFKHKGAAKVGERYVIFRTASELTHPKTGKRFGYLTHLIGTMVITRLNGSLATGQIQNDTWDEVLRGDLIGPYSETLREVVALRPNAHDVKGFIVESLTPYLTTFGEHHVVVVDKGSADGVKTGNTFVIVRQHDPGTDVKALLFPAQYQHPKLPLEDVGTCMAVNVKDRASMCLLTRSIREIMPGDRVEMRTSGHPPTAQR